MTDTEIANLSDLDLLKQYLFARGPYGEKPSWLTNLEWDSNGSLELGREISRRGLKTPRCQSIGRQATSEYTQDERDAWVQLVEDWDGSSPAPVGSDLS
jgi:hypothetical protein